jgi:RNA polymerase sigma-70 factor (ECF subfamily)
MLDNYFEDDVKTALENLPYQFRLVVLLCDVEGFSYNEIATIIDSPLGTVMSRLYRGRKLLQRLLWNYAKNKGYINENTKIKK